MGTTLGDARVMPLARGTKVPTGQVASISECYTYAMGVYFGYPGERSWYHYTNAAVFGAATGGIMAVYCALNY